MAAGFDRPTKFTEVACMEHSFDRAIAKLYGRSNPYISGTMYIPTTTQSYMGLHTYTVRVWLAQKCIYLILSRHTLYHTIMMLVASPHNVPPFR